MSARYAQAYANPQGPGDARPTAMQIIKDEGLEGNMKDKVFLITGCSSGIGIETARALAATGARLFLGVRNMEKGRQACSSFLSPGRVELLSLDTSSLSSVRAAAATFLSHSQTLNGLVCNAGIMMTPSREATADGFEGQLATNYLGHFLLFWLLRDALQRASTPAFQSRLVNVSSSGHHASEVCFDDLNLASPGAYAPSKAYGQSKLAQIYMANHVERLYGPKGIHALSLMPGGIDTGLQVHFPAELKERFAADPKVVAFMKSVEQGAATTVFAAVAGEWEGRGGRYLEDCGESEPLVPGEEGAKGYKEYVYDERKEERLWEMTLKMLEL